MKRSHMIDLLVMRVAQRVCCRDVQVMRGANCWTDHKLVRAKLVVNLQHMHKRERRMLPFSVHQLSTSARRDEYRCHLEKVLQDQPHCHDLSTEENWSVLKSCIVSAAEKTVGRGKRKQPEWFEESAEKLMPLRRMLTVNYVAAKREFAEDGEENSG